MKTFGIKLIVLWLLWAGVGSILAAHIGAPAEKIFDNIRTPLTAGLTALGALMMTTRATWLGRLKESYEAVEHIDNVNELRERGYKVEYYGGFNRLAAALNTLTFIVIISAISQFTVSLWASPYAPGICLGAGAGAFTIFFYLLYRVRRVEAFWIKKLERDQEAKQRLELKKQRSQETAATA